MKGDVSRITFGAAKHYRSVEQQQGRVQLDADWNELQDISAHIRRTTTRDIVGPAGGPHDNAAFALTAVGGSIEIGPGRYYVNGRLIEVEAPVDIAAQPHLPANAPIVVLPGGDAPLPAPPGLYLAYVDVWDRTITALEDPDLLDPALQGVDTTTRRQSIWQLKLLRVGNVGANVSCDDPLPAWNALFAASDALLRARAVPADPAADCEFPADAGFRRGENQNYLVRIVNPGAVGVATFVWSREFGSVATSWLGRNGNNLQVAMPGRDDVLGFATGNWVELRDDRNDLLHLPGTLVQLADVRDDVLEIDPVTATGSVDILDFPDKPRIVRWESPGEITVEIPATNQGYLPLEDGVEVRFEAGSTYSTDEYWSIPGRTNLNDVLWPEDGLGDPLAVPPLGVEHDFAGIGLVEFDNAWTVISDCRDLFPAITELTSLEYLGGDGQQMAPNPANPAALVPLPAALRVGVANGEHPVVGATVRFTIIAGNGDLGGGGGASVDVATNVNGVAQTAWAIDSVAASQQVVAELVDGTGARVHLPIVFTAVHALAGNVAYDPAQCADLAGMFTVQDAIDRLCQVQHGGCATIVVSPGPNWFAPILALPDGADARICFRVGDYLLDDALEIAGKGHLTISGAGPGTVVTAVNTETALRFVSCAGVSISSMAVVSQRVGDGRARLNGAVTVIDCPTVRVEAMLLRSAAAARRTAACLTVRGTTTPIQSVRVHDCDFVVGHSQIGLLIVNAAVSQVTGNVMRVPPKPRSLSLGNLVANSAIRAGLVRRLVGSPEISVVGRGSFNTALRVGNYGVRFDSAVPDSEWSALVAESPPAAADLDSDQTVRAYVNRLVDQTTENPAAMPTYRRHREGLVARIGRTEMDRFMGVGGGAALRASLVAGDMSIADLTDPANGPRNTVVAVDDGAVAFDSPLSAGVWGEMLAATEGAGSPINRLTDVAGRIIDDETFRGNFRPAAAWFATLAVQNPAVAAQGIVIGGTVARSVTVADNVAVGVAEMVHVGLSQRAGPGANPDLAGTVRITNNRGELRVPVQHERGARGIFVGNAANAIIEGNDTVVSGRSGQAFIEGVRVWGHFGARIEVNANTLGGCETGVRVRPEASPPARRIWRVADNLAVDASTGVQAPASVARSGNVPV